MQAQLAWLLVAILFSTGTSLFAQKISAQKEAEVRALLDSADVYKLTDPARMLEYAQSILMEVPVQGNESLIVPTLVMSANSEKIRGNFDKALEYASRAVEVSMPTQNPELIVRACFMKATVFDLRDNQLHFLKIIYC